ncbi:MAG TPA: extracellular solute-binding protein [Clostridiales bacterium]|nr:extracellular solute-binding protein [Clostridiales bacterium]
MKKVLSLFLAVVLVLSLAACSKPATQPEPTKTPDTPAETPTPEPTEEPPKEPVKITVEVFDRGTDGGKTDPTNNYWTDWIKQKLLEDENIEVTFIPVSRWEETEQLNNLMAAGTAPDVCYTYSGDLVSLYREQGGLTVLNPYMDLLKDLDELLGEDESLPGRRLIERNRIAETGEIHSIPARRMNVAGINTFIRKDWLDKLNLPIPNTIDEFFDTLVAFKENADVLGVDVIPFEMTTDVRWRAEPLIHSFIDPNLSDKEKWINTVIDRNYLLPGVKEGYRFLNKMYNAGLIDPEFYLYKDDVKNEEYIKAGRVGSFIHNWDQPYRGSPSLVDSMRENFPDAEYITIDPFVNSVGKRVKMKYNQAGLNVFVPSFSKNAEAAVRYINWLAKPEVYRFLQFGEEGVNHEVVNGLPRTIAATGPTIQNSLNNIDYTLNMNGIWLGDHETTLKAIANGYSCEPHYIENAMKTALNDAYALPVVPVTLTVAGPYSEDLKTKGEVGTCNAIRAPESEFDKIWDEFIADWKASGADEIIAERAAKYIEP